jgi:hypothetical protein
MLDDVINIETLFGRLSVTLAADTVKHQPGVPSKVSGKLVEGLQVALRMTGDCAEAEDWRWKSLAS